MWILSDCESYMSKCNYCVLLSESIHVFMHLLCWIYSHLLVAGWAPAPLWCKFAGISLVAVSLGGWLWSPLVYLLLLGVFIESMLWSVTLEIGDLFYLNYVFEFYCIQFLLKLWWDVYFKVFENYSAATFFLKSK